MKINILTRFSVFWVVVATLFSSAGLAASEPYSFGQSRALIQVMDQSVALLNFDCNVPETKRCPSREGNTPSSIAWDLAQAGLNLAAPRTILLKHTALQFSRDFFNLSIQSSKHHPPTSI